MKISFIENLYTLYKNIQGYLSFHYERIKKFYFFFFFFLILIYFTIWNVLSNMLNTEFVKGLFNNIPYISTIKDFIKHTITFIIDIILNSYPNLILSSTPVLLALTYFIYREQQNTSLKNQNFGLLFHYLCLSISGLIITYYLNVNFFPNKSKFTEKLNVVELYPFEMIIFIIIILISFIILFSLIHKLIQGLNSSYQLKKSRKKMKKYLSLVYFMDNNKNNNYKAFYKSIHNYLESIFQLLDYLSTNKMDKLFKEEFDNLSYFLVEFMEQSPRSKFTIFPKKLYENHATDFSNLYSVIIRNIGDFVFLLFDKNKLSDMQNAFNILESLEPNKVPELYQYYFKGIEEISLKAITVKSFPIDKVLNLLESIASKIDDDDLERQKMMAGIILIYQSILEVTAKENLINDTTIITYSLDSCINNFNKIPPPLKVVHLDHQFENAMLKSFTSFYNENHESHDVTNLKRITLFILLQATLKSIEVGNYGVTGQLIKRITTDFNGSNINNVFDDFYKSKGDLKVAYEDFSHDYTLNDLITNFDFNNRSFEYCIQKLLLLLLGQEALIIKQNIDFTTFYKDEKNREFVNLSYFNITYLDYVVHKIKSVGLNYGLVFVGIENYIDDLAEYIKNTVKPPTGK